MSCKTSSLFPGQIMLTNQGITVFSNIINMMSSLLWAELNILTHRGPYSQPPEIYFPSERGFYNEWKVDSMVNMLRIPHVHTRRGAGKSVFTQMLCNLMSMEIGTEAQEKNVK